MLSRSVVIRTFVLGLALPGVFAACSDDSIAPSPDAGAAQADGSPLQSDAGDASSAEADASADAVPMAPLEAQGMAVLHADRMTASLSLLTTTGTIALDDCLHSGSVPAQLTLALSRDVVFPSQIQPSREVVVIDRMTGTLTYVEPSTCAVNRQIQVANKFDGNPHDVLALSADKAYVTRYNRNLKATSAPEDLDDGNDILVFNPTSGALLKRIDLSSSTTGNAADEILPRADRMVAVGRFVYVSLNLLSDDYKKAGPGRVVVIDSQTDAVVAHIDLPSLKNCGALTTFPGGIFVSCGGLFADGAMQAQHSGVARITTPDHQVQLVGSSVFGGAVISWSSLAALDAERFAALSLGDFGAKTSDALWGAKVTGPSAVKGFTGSKSYSLGALVAQPSANQYWVADFGTDPHLRSFTADANGVLAPGPIVKTSLTRKLPPHEIAWY